MIEYSSKISLSRNSRGVYCLDTSIGCESGMSNTKGGCYGDCYAANAAKRYGHDFSKTVLRFFENEKHKRQIVSQIDRAKMDFVRIGCSGDPSENWDHCFDVLKVISRSNKEIVIITRHWNTLTNDQLKYLSTLNICINTSVSALDEPDLRNWCLNEYKRIKPYCRSVLRVVSCDFNLENETGQRLAQVQSDLFKNEDILDTVFRPNKNNPFVTSGIINVAKGLFLGKQTLMSKFNRKTFTGKCGTCHQMCGVTMKNENYSYPLKRPLTKQLSIFK